MDSNALKKLCHKLCLKLHVELANCHVLKRYSVHRVARRQQQTIAFSFVMDRGRGREPHDAFCDNELVPV